ncbi:unnamed protein product, partial [Polarella glacialis]
DAVAEDAARRRKALEDLDKAIAGDTLPRSPASAQSGRDGAPSTEHFHLGEEAVPVSDGEAPELDDMYDFSSFLPVGEAADLSRSTISAVHPVLLRLQAGIREIRELADTQLIADIVLAGRGEDPALARLRRLLFEQEHVLRLALGEAPTPDARSISSSATVSPDRPPKMPLL